MLDAIKDIGERVIKNEKKERIDMLVQDISAHGIKTKKEHKYKVLTLLFDGNNYEYIGVDEEEYSRSKVLSYLFRSDSRSKQMPYVPTVMANSQFSRVVKWFDNMTKKESIKKLQVSENDVLLLESLKKSINNNKDIIERDIANKIEEDKDSRYLLVLKIGDKYIGEIELFRQLFLKNYDNRLKHSKSKHVCSICGEEKEDIIGGVTVYTFSSFDKEGMKPGFLKGGFSEEYLWKNFPVCEECNYKLEVGRKYIENNLTFQLAHMTYQLIPKLIFGGDKETEEVFNALTSSNRVNELRDKDRTVYLGTEKEIFDYLAGVNDSLVLDFLFLDKKAGTSSERISLLIEDVYPSRIKALFEAKLKVDKQFPVMRRGDRAFTFDTIKNFFYKTDEKSKNNDLEGYFLDITDKIFRNIPIDVNFVMKFVMLRIRSQYNQYFANNSSYGYYEAVREGVMFLSFLSCLNLIKNREVAMDERIFEPLFAKYEKLYDIPEKKGLALLGVCADMLLAKQSIETKERKNRPFWEQLKSLEMKQNDFLGLFPKIRNKFEEYGSFDKGKQIVMEEALYYLAKAGTKWNLSIEEMNFYFVSGMELLSKQVRDIVYTNKEEEVVEDERNN